MVLVLSVVVVQRVMVLSIDHRWVAAESVALQMVGVPALAMVVQPWALAIPVKL